MRAALTCSLDLTCDRCLALDHGHGQWALRVRARDWPGLQRAHVAPALAMDVTCIRGRKCAKLVNCNVFPSPDPVLTRSLILSGVLKNHPVSTVVSTALRRGASASATCHKQVCCSCPLLPMKSKSPSGMKKKKKKTTTTTTTTAAAPADEPAEAPEELNRAQRRAAKQAAYAAATEGGAAAPARTGTAAAGETPPDEEAIARLQARTQASREDVIKALAAVKRKREAKAAPQKAETSAPPNLLRFERRRQAETSAPADSSGSATTAAAPKSKKPKKPRKDAPEVMSLLPEQRATVIGRGGGTITRLQEESGARLAVDRDACTLKITGNKQQVCASAAPLPRRVFRVLAARLC